MCIGRYCQGSVRSLLRTLVNNVKLFIVAADGVMQVTGRRHHHIVFSPLPAFYINFCGGKARLCHWNVSSLR